MKAAFEAAERTVFAVENQAVKLRIVKREERRKLAVDVLDPVLSKLLPFPINLFSRFIAGLLVDLVVWCLNKWFGHDWLANAPKPPRK